MTIFIMYTQQKTHGQVVGHQTQFHAAQIVWPSGHALHCALYSVTLRTVIHALLVYLGAVAQRKEC